MNEQKRMGILREVALRSDGFYEKAQELGQKAAVALKRDKRSQITGLEGIANSALKTTDVFDFIKLRTARHKKGEWSWGPALLDVLSKDLRNDKNSICEQLKIEPPNSLEGLEVHLLLIREFVRQLAAQYEYECWKNEPEKANG